jgi:hypothetical protein
MLLVGGLALPLFPIMSKSAAGAGRQMQRVIMPFHVLFQGFLPHDISI